MNYLVTVEKAFPQNGVFKMTTELTPRLFVGKATKLATDLFRTKCF